MLGALLSLLKAPIDWIFQEEERIDDYKSAMETRYEEIFGEPWIELEKRVLARNPRYAGFKDKQ